MNTRNWKVLVGLTLTTCWCRTDSNGQTLPFIETAGSGSTAVNFEFRLDGSILERGLGPLRPWSNTDLQANSVFLWYPTLHALRAGGGSTETVSTIGPYSVAFGLSTSAEGECAFASGNGSLASGPYSTALGAGSEALGEGSTAMGLQSYATADYSTAVGSSLAGADYSTAMGLSNAWGLGSTAMGASIADGEGTTALGLNSIAEAYNSVAIGQYNVGAYGPNGKTTWIPTDPIFEIGNGTPTVRSDALVVYKNGNAVFQGSITVGQASGDIPMYTGN